MKKVVETNFSQPVVMLPKDIFQDFLSRQPSMVRTLGTPLKTRSSLVLNNVHN